MFPSSLLSEFREAYAKHDGKTFWLEIARPGTVDYSGNHEFIGLPALPTVGETQYDYEMWLGFTEDAETAARDFRCLASRAGAYLSTAIKAELVGNNRGKGAAELWCLLLFHDYTENLDDFTLNLIGEGCGHGMMFPPWMHPYPYSIELIGRLTTKKVNTTKKPASPQDQDTQSTEVVLGDSLMNTRRFQIALSFPGEFRSFVEEIADELANQITRERVFYDRYYEAELARPNLDTHLHRIYHDDADLIVVFLCQDYNDKDWCHLEARAVRDLIKQRRDDEVMFVRVDDGDVAGVFSVDGYVDAKGRPPKEIAEIILQRLQIVQNAEPLADPAQKAAPCAVGQNESAPNGKQYSDPQTVEEVRVWCRQTRKGLRDAIDNYDEGCVAGLDPIEVGPHPVAEAVRDAANHVADLGNFDLARQLTAATLRGIGHEDALSLLMQVEEWCVGAATVELRIGTPVTTNSHNSPLATWQKKLDYLQQQEAITADPAQKFALHKKIQEAERQIAELESQAAPEFGGSDTPAKKWEPHPNTKVAIGHLPQPGKHFVGRDDQLELLDKAWLDPRTNIVEFVAFGGVGKSALVAHWLKQMQADRWRGAARVFGHSFYSQGSREDAQASADSFLDQALRFFGDTDPTEGSPWDKGERLARLVRRQPTLLILDGVEPLQSPGAAADAGQIRDPGLQALVRELAGGMNGLVVISSRAQVADIEGWEDSSVQRHQLDHLSVEAGTLLLREIGVEGTEEEVAEAVQNLGGHALCVSLVGKYVVNAGDGHIANYEEIALHEIGQTLAPKAGRCRNPAHTSQTFSRIIQRYEVWLSGLQDREGDVEVRGRLALEIVRLTGLFDRPITAGEFAALVGKGPIPGLTDLLSRASEGEVNLMIGRLVEYGLITKVTDSTVRLSVPSWPELAASEVVIDAHPLVREHFAAQLEEHFANAAREAHRRLYEHLKKSAPELPKNLNDMMSLCHAVAHGCKAGLHKQAYEEVYQPRMFYKKFLRDRLGAVGMNIDVLSNFTDRDWTRAARQLPVKMRAEILTNIGLDLRFQGRFGDAERVMTIGLNCFTEVKDWEGAAEAGRHLSQKFLVSGDMSRALDLGIQSVHWANPRVKPYEQVFTRASLGDVLFQLGRVKDAESAFREAEELEQSISSGHKYLYRLPGYRFCCLLLERGDYDEVIRRVKAARDWPEQNFFSIGRQLNEVIMGRALLGLGDLEGARQTISNAVEVLRDKQRPQFLVIGLLAEAEIHRECHDFERCQELLLDIEDLLRRTPMLLWQVESLLEQARLAKSRSDDDGRGKFLALAREIVDKANCKFERKDYDEGETSHVSDFVTQLVTIEEVGYGRCRRALEKLL